MDELSQNDPGRGRLQAARYHVYVDWTTESTPRPFYVGKGKTPRVSRFIRNKRHTNVASKHGINRVIVLSTDDETRAFSDEVRLIAEHHTFIGDPRYNGVGCNYTLGGDGASGCSPSMKTRKKLSEKASVFMLGNKNGLGKTKTPEERLHISSSLQGHIVSETTRLKISQRLIGRKLSVEHVIRSAEGHRGGGKPVEQMNGNVVVALFASAKLAQDATGVNRSKICDCCKNKRARAGGYGWRYAN